MGTAADNTLKFTIRDDDIPVVNISLPMDEMSNPITNVVKKGQLYLILMFKLQILTQLQNYGDQLKFHLRPWKVQEIA